MHMLRFVHESHTTARAQQKKDVILREGIENIQYQIILQVQK